jgi:hypothetical protein
MALAKLQAGAKPEFSSILESLQLGGEGKTVSLMFSLPSEVIDMIAALGAQHRADPDKDDDHDEDEDEDVDSDEPPQPPEPPMPPAPPRPPR